MKNKKQNKIFALLAVAAVFLTGLFFKNEAINDKGIASGQKNNQGGEVDSQKNNFSLTDECAEENDDEYMFIGCNGFF